MDIQDIKKRYAEAYIEDFGDFEIVHIDKKELDWLIEKVEKYEKVLKNISEMPKVGWNSEYVLERYSEYAKNALNGKFED